MGKGYRHGISSAVAAVALLVVALAIGMVALSIFVRNVNVAVSSAELEAGRQAVKTPERLTLVYWSRDGRAWIANDGPEKVTIVQVYVDANLAWSGTQAIPPRETAVMSVGYGSSLIVKTGTGMLHVLRREEVR